MEAVKIRNHSLDVLKAICAFLIVFRHSPAPYVTLLHPVTGCAVSCFFMISGYCLYCEHNMHERISKAIRRMFIILCWSTLLYLPLAFLYARQINDYSAFSVSAFKNFIIYGEHPFACHLWYIASYLYVLGLIWLYCKAGYNLKFLFYYIPVVFLIYFIVCRHFLSIYMTVPVDVIPRWLYLGLPCVLIGMWYKRKTIHRKLEISSSKVLVLILVFIWLSFMENYNAKASDNSLSSICVAFLLLILFSVCFPNKKTASSYIGEKCSFYIYIFHIWIIYVVGAFIGHYGISYINIFYIYLSPVIIYIIITVGTGIAEHFIHKKFN